MAQQRIAHPFQPFPPRAAWRHHTAREGFETTFFREGPGGGSGGGIVLAGHTAAVEDGEAWAVRYEVEVDERWATRRVRAWGWTAGGERRTTLEADREGRWLVDGERAAHLDGCLDVDFESSACTNTLPVHRLGLAVREGADAPAAYVRAVDLSVERLEQRYTRRPDAQADVGAYDYVAPVFAFAARLTYDRAGLIVDYPGLATRVL